MLTIPASFGAIRPWSDTDVDSIVKYADNRNVWLNLRDGFPHPYTRDDARSFLALVKQQNPMTFFAIASDDKAIGAIGITLNQDVHRLTAELGYWIGEPFWGKGIMSEAVRLFTDFAFDNFRLVRIYAEPYTANKGSCRVLEKAGYSLEGRLRSNVIKDNQILDQFLFARVRP
jgi:RimJ/RimL family protein N-acetyltransferase